MVKALFVTLFVFLLIALIFMFSRRPVGDYSDIRGPSYQGNYAQATAEFDGNLRVVAWNMHYGENLDQETAVLATTDELRDADLLLLQEMSAQGVEQLAQTLSYNYVFYPAAMHRQRQEEYGNAILSKWPLADTTKIVLPNWLPSWLQSRNAARGVVIISDMNILVYSVHLDTTWMIPWWGLTQGKYLAQNIHDGYDLAIVGGDFNTWTPRSIRTLDSSMQKAGMERLTRDRGHTFEYSGLKLTLDHIFGTEGFDYQAGVYYGTDASDHYPLWAEIAINDQD